MGCVTRIRGLLHRPSSMGSLRESWECEIRTGFCCMDLMIVAVFDLPQLIRIGNDHFTSSVAADIPILPIQTDVITPIPTPFNIA